MAKIDPSKVPTRSGTRYPPPFDRPCRQRHWACLADAAGLTQFGVNLVTLAPGAWSSQRHWHSDEDEFVYILSGELVLVTDAGRSLVQAGDSAGFPAGTPDGHHLLNESAEPAQFLVVGSRNKADCVHYADIDLHLPAFAEDEAPCFTRKDGTRY